ncbi:Crp/Fnr family transcriptional regulator [Defluviimonas sp. SAOS-178_SWC]|uniref:Crp/Fnr family transcriptional regulator n=1 Tax=Defluviimonas sp. SAOS-178_SWC TaxID=3121287 RepID=UPI003221FE6E
MGEKRPEDPSGSVLLSSLPDGDLGDLLSLAHHASYAAGQMIFSRADLGETLLLIEEGRVEISITALSGRKSVLNHMGPGEALGEIALLDGGPRSADAVATTPVRGLLLYRRDVMGFLRERPQALFALVAELCGKVRNASEMFATQAQTEAPSRLARALIRLAERWGEDTDKGALLPSERFSQSDLGDFSGISRENVNRRLRAWAGDGIIEMTPQGIYIRDRDALREIAGL